MSALRSTKHPRVAPMGYDYNEVLNKGKIYYIDQDFEMQPFKSGMKTLWSATDITIPPVKRPAGTIFVKHIADGWEIISPDKEVRKKDRDIPLQGEEDKYSKFYNKGNDCDCCQNQYLTGEFGDGWGCRCKDDGKECNYQEVNDTRTNK